jgi:hypothetical protein
VQSWAPEFLRAFEDFLPTLSAVAKLDASINVGTEARWVHFGAQLCSSGGNFSALRRGLWLLRA